MIKGDAVRTLILSVVLLVGGSALGETYDKDAARAAFERGTRHYNLAEYPKALDEFREAYRNYPEPSFLYNIAQCYRQVGDKPNAIRFYRTYLRETPNASNRDEVNRLISALERAVADEQMTKSNQPPPTAAPQSSTVTATQPARTDLTATAPAREERKPLVKRGWFWAAVIGGAAAAGLAVGLGVGLGTQRDPSPTYGTILKN